MTLRMQLLFLDIPFKEKFSHSSFERKSSETVVVEVSDENGVKGVGEGCPRSYVTGESFASAESFFLEIKDKVCGFTGFDELKKFVSANRSLIDKNPSAWCGVELALIDYLSRKQKKSAEEAYGVLASADLKKYSAVIGIGSHYKFIKRALLFRCAGFCDFKYKLSGDLDIDMLQLKILSYFAKAIRVDGNNLFKTFNEAFTYLQKIKKYIWAIEEPIVANNFGDLIKLSGMLKLKIIVDESFLNLNSFYSLENRSDVFIPNIRISKLGGPIRTMELVELLERNNFKWILGTHVGETSLLSRVALMIQSGREKYLQAKEGSFSNHLIQDDPFYPHIKLSFGAKLGSVLEIEKYGWGMTFSPRPQDIVKKVEF